MIATCTRCNNSFDGNDGPEHTNHITAFGHPPEQHYQVIADLSAVGNPPVTLEIPEPIADLIRTGALTLAIVPDPDQPRGIGLREITLNPPSDADELQPGSATTGPTDAELDEAYTVQIGLLMDGAEKRSPSTPPPDVPADNRADENREPRPHSTTCDLATGRHYDNECTCGAENTHPNGTTP